MPKNVKVEHDFELYITTISIFESNGYLFLVSWHKILHSNKAVAGFHFVQRFD